MTIYRDRLLDCKACPLHKCLVIHQDDWPKLSTCVITTFSDANRVDTCYWLADRWTEINGQLALVLAVFLSMMDDVMEYLSGKEIQEQA